MSGVAPAGEADFRIGCDVAVIGAGVAGLWSWRRLRAAGLDALLLSAGPVGAGQTIASQGIIHGGIKYALTGEATRASEMIAAMPERWANCLAGRPAPGDPDLSGVRVLTDHQHLWTTRGVVSRIGGLAASKALRTGVERVTLEQRPEAFRSAPRDVDVYRVDEPVIEPRSLAAALLGDGAGALRVDGVGTPGVKRATAEAHPLALHVTIGGQRPALIEPRAIVCAAGAGNEAFVRYGGGSLESCAQRRALHMVMARGRMPVIFGHCVSASSLPLATVTSQHDAQGRTVWYVGGALAESGVERSRERQINEAKRELAGLIPWVNLAGAEWATLRIARAEGLPEGMKRGKRPDAPVVRRFGRYIVAWPTKLAFAPLLAEMVERAALERLAEPDAREGNERRIERRPERFAPHSGDDSGALLETPPVAPLPWDDPGVRWT